MKTNYKKKRKEAWDAVGLWKEDMQCLILATTIKHYFPEIKTSNEEIIEIIKAINKLSVNHENNL